jgi:hypothetical protein
LTTVFLPEYGAFSRPAGTYSAIYRIIEGSPMRFVNVPGTRIPEVYKTHSEAYNAAKCFVRELLNKGRSAVIDNPIPEQEQDLMGIEEWRKGKQEEYASVKAIARSKAMAKVVVENRHKRRQISHGKTAKASGT